MCEICGGSPGAHESDCFLAPPSAVGVIDRPEAEPVEEPEREPEPPVHLPDPAPASLLEIEHLETMIEHQPDLAVQSEPVMFGYTTEPRSVPSALDIIPGGAARARKMFGRR